MRNLWGPCHILNPVKQHFGEPTYLSPNISFHLSENCLKTYAGPTGYVSYTHLCEKTLCGNHISTDVVSLG